MPFQAVYIDFLSKDKAYRIFPVTLTQQESISNLNEYILLEEDRLSDMFRIYLESDREQLFNDLRIYGNDRKEDIDDFEQFQKHFLGHLIMSPTAYTYLRCSFTETCQVHEVEIDYFRESG